MTLKIKSKSPKSNQLFPPFQQSIYLCEFGQNPSTGSKYSAGKFKPCFGDFRLRVRAWKLGQGHQNLINSSPSPNNVSLPVWSKSMDWFRTSEDNPLKPYFGHFKVMVWPWKWGQGHQNLINTFPPPNNVSVHAWSKSTLCFRRYHTETIFWTFQSVAVALKYGHSHQNLINSFPPPNNVYMQVWSNPSTDSEDSAWKRTF